MKKKLLVDVLTKVMAGVDQKELHAEDTDLITFDKGWITSYSGEIAISHKLNLNIRCSVPAAYLYQVLRDMNIDDVVLKIDGSSLIISDKNSNKILDLKIKERDLSGETVLKVDDERFVDIPKDFMEALKFCSFSASEDPTMEILNSVFFINSEVYSSDNYRLSGFTMSESIDDGFALPIRAVKDILKFGSKINKHYSDGRWIHFGEFNEKGNLGMVYHAMLVLGDYPYQNIRDFFDGLETEKTIDLPKDKILASASIAEKIGYEEASQSKSVSIYRDKKKDVLIVEGKRKEVGSYREVIEVDEAKDFPKDVILDINPDFLKDILKVTNKLDVIGGGRGMRFKEGKFQHYMTNTLG